MLRFLPADLIPKRGEIPRSNLAQYSGQTENTNQISPVGVITERLTGTIDALRSDRWLMSGMMFGRYIIRGSTFLLGGLLGMVSETCGCNLLNADK